MSIRDYWIQFYLQQKRVGSPAFSQLLADQEVLERFGEEGKAWIKAERAQVRLDLDRIDESPLGGKAHP